MYGNGLIECMSEMLDLSCVAERPGQRFVSF